MTTYLASLTADRIQSDPIAIESDLEAIFLGEDMDAICSVAIAAEDSVLILNAALPLKNREAAFRNWRKKQVIRMLSLDDDFKLFHEKQDPELWESISEGEMTLQKVAEQLTNWRQKQVLELLRENTDFQLFHVNCAPTLWDSLQKGKIPLSKVTDDISKVLRKVALAQSKKNIRATVNASIHDCPSTKEGMILPSVLVILETGEVEIFRHRATASEWARNSGVAFLLGNFDQKTFRLNYGPLAV